MATESIIEINVGGRLFQTTVFTLTKYPGSMLSAMFVHTDTGMLPMPKTKDGQYFLDADPKYFEIILNWLRLGEITTNDPDIMKGTLSLANYFGLEELMEKLKTLQDKSKLFKRQSYPEILHICIGNYALRQYLKADPRTRYADSYSDHKILFGRKNKLTRVRQSLIAKFFDGEDVYVPIAYDVKSGLYVFDEDAVCSKNPQINGIYVVKCALEFLESDTYSIFHGIDVVTEIKVLLWKLGIHEVSHYKLEKIAESENIKEYKKDGYRCSWNDEFIMEYANYCAI